MNRNTQIYKLYVAECTDVMNGDSNQNLISIYYEDMNAINIANINNILASPDSSTFPTDSQLEHFVFISLENVYIETLRIVNIQLTVVAVEDIEVSFLPFGKTDTSFVSIFVSNN